MSYSAYKIHWESRFHSELWVPVWYSKSWEGAGTTTTVNVSVGETDWRGSGNPKLSYDSAIRVTPLKNPSKTAITTIPFLRIYIMSSQCILNSAGRTGFFNAYRKKLHAHSFKSRKKNERENPPPSPWLFPFGWWKPQHNYTHSILPLVCLSLLSLLYSLFKSPSSSSSHYYLILFSIPLYSQRVNNTA